jgi:hypothetical protein
MSGETVPDISSPADISPGGIVSWLLGILCAIIAFLWRLNENKNGKAIDDLDARLKASDAKHDDCEKDRGELGKALAVVSERLKHVENQLVHKAD